jgi:hypothetical protein
MLCVFLYIFSIGHATIHMLYPEGPHHLGGFCCGKNHPIEYRVSNPKLITATVPAGHIHQINLHFLLLYFDFVSSPCKEEIGVSEAVTLKHKPTPHLLRFLRLIRALIVVSASRGAAALLREGIPCMQNNDHMPQHCCTKFLDILSRPHRRQKLSK